MKIYTKITTLDVSCPIEEITVDENLQDDKIVHVFNTKPAEFTFKLTAVDRNTLLSILYGRTVTNNWLKMHGGVKTWRKQSVRYI